MRSTISPSLAFVFACLFCLGHADVQGVPPSGFSAEQNAANGIDLHAIAVLQQLKDSYKSMQSFSTEWEEGRIGKDGNILFLYRAQLAFRRPDQIAFTVGKMNTQFPESSKVIANGKHEYLMQAMVPHAYTELLDLKDADSPFAITERIHYLRGVECIERLLKAQENEMIYRGWKLRSLSTKQETLKQDRFTEDMPVETITARWESTEKPSTDWETRTYSIGTRDHLLYQTTDQNQYDSEALIARFHHSRRDAILSDSVFAVPRRATLLPLSHVVDANEETVTLDKGRLDGLAVGDRLCVFLDEKMHIKNASLLILKTQAHTCTALIETTSVGPHIGEVCMVFERKMTAKPAKHKPIESSWIWMMEMQ